MNPISPDFQIFMTCADSGSFLRASEQLRLQQAGISRLIKRLESQLGQDLFNRGSRGVTLTEYGQTLYESLLQTHHFWEDTYSSKLSKEQGLSGRFRIVCHASIAATLFPKFFEGLVKKFPLLKIETELMPSVHATRAVAENKADLAIVVNPVKNPELTLQKFGGEFIGLWRSKGNREDELLINPQMFQNAKIRESFRGRRFIEIPDYEVIGNLLNMTSLQGLLPSSVAARWNLEQVGPALLNVHFHLVCHRKRLLKSQKGPVHEYVWQQLKA